MRLSIGVLEAIKSSVVVRFDKEASQTRDYCIAAFLNKSCATQRAVRPDPARRKERLLGMTN
jgi:hypothetical protein